MEESTGAAAVRPGRRVAAAHLSGARFAAAIAMSSRDEHEDLAETRQWIAEIADEMGGATVETARHALRGVLFALRDRPASSEAVALAAQLPLLLRGVFFPGSRGWPRLQKHRNGPSFLERVASELLPLRDERSVLDDVRAALAVLGSHVTAAELRQVRALLPAEIRALWPTRPRRPRHA